MAPAWAKLCSRKRVAPVEAPVRGPSASGQLRRFQWAPVGSCDQCALIADSSMRDAFRSHKPQMHACGSRTTVALPPTNSSVTAYLASWQAGSPRKPPVQSAFVIICRLSPLSKSPPRPATHPYNPPSLSTQPRTKSYTTAPNTHSLPCPSWAFLALPPAHPTRSCHPFPFLDFSQMSPVDAQTPCSVCCVCCVVCVVCVCVCHVIIETTGR